MPTRREVFQSFAAASMAAAPAAQSGKIRHIDIIHHWHTGVDYTDLPAVTREFQVRFLDSAIEACLLNPRFRWTCEVTMTIDDFWRQDPAARRAQFVQRVKKGQMDVMAPPFNQAPLMNARQWRLAMDWPSAYPERVFVPVANLICGRMRPTVPVANLICGRMRPTHAGRRRHARSPRTQTLLVELSEHGYWRSALATVGQLGVQCPGSAHSQQVPNIHTACVSSGGAPFVPMVEPADLRDRDHRPESRRLDGA